MTSISVESPNGLYPILDKRKKEKYLIFNIVNKYKQMYTKKHNKLYFVRI